MLLIGGALFLSAFLLFQVLDVIAKRLIIRSGDPVASAILNKSGSMPFGHELARGAIDRSQPRWISGLKTLVKFVGLAGVLVLIVGLMGALRTMILKVAFTYLITRAVITLYRMSQRRLGSGGPLVTLLAGMLLWPVFLFVDRR